MCDLTKKCEYPGAIKLRMFVIPTPLWLPLVMSFMVAAASGQKVEELPASASAAVTSSQTGTGSQPDIAPNQDRISLTMHEALKQAEQPLPSRIEKETPRN